MTIIRDTSYFQVSEYYEYMVIADMKSQKYYQLVPKTSFVSKEYKRYWQWVEYSDVTALITALQSQVDTLSDDFIIHINDATVHFTGTEKATLLAQVSALNLLLPLPAHDGNTYGLKNGVWTAVSGGSGTVQTDNITIVGDGSTLDKIRFKNLADNKTYGIKNGALIEIIIPTKTSQLTNDSNFITGADVPTYETDPIFNASEAANFVAGDKANLDNQSGVNTGDQSSSDFDHNALQNTHNLSTDIDHNSIVNTHTIPPQAGDAADNIANSDTLPFLQFIGGLWKKITFSNFVTAISSSLSSIFASFSSVNEMDMTGLVAWNGSGNYYTLDAAGVFTILRAGEGRIRGAAITWAGGEDVTLTANKGYFIVITATNTLSAIDVNTLLDSDVATQHANFRALFQNNIILFSCWYDGNENLTIEQGHPYNYQSTITAHDHVRFGSVFIGTGAVITFLNAADRTIKLVGNDAIDDHGVVSDILDSAGAAISIIGIWRNNAGLAQRYHRRNFTVSGVTTAPTAGAVYTHNGTTYTVLFTNAGKTLIEAWGSTWVNQPLASGTLTKVSGTGDATITFSAVTNNRVVPSSYLVGNSPVPLTASGATRYGIYAIYTIVGDLQTPTTAAPTPQFIAIMSSTAYVSIAAAEQSLGTAPYPNLTQFVIPTEIHALEPVLTGIVICDGADRSIEINSNSSGFISGVRSFKQTANQSGGAGAVAVGSANNVTTVTTNFTNILSSTDTTVQAALDTLDDCASNAQIIIANQMFN